MTQLALSKDCRTRSLVVLVAHLLDRLIECLDTIRSSITKHHQLSPETVGVFLDLMGFEHGNLSNELIPNIWKNDGYMT